ncbi:GTP binding protein [Lunasporangiospora selenospora]|uniref:GTP binding protein n=1 Tax=Lunasporangiospora selenospora TaxID=979761 RepID=A0A9P6FZB3_9FUNG|nr:GTP binding protein [Lunasporangiospora selenospora]
MAVFQTPATPLDTSPWENHQGSLPPEVDVEGNIEYKLKLIATAPDRFEHLVTQLKWRLSEGNGVAIYEIGVADDGSFVGLSPADMDVSLKTLHRMAEFLGADVAILRKVSVASTQHSQRGDVGKSQAVEERDTYQTSTTPTAIRKHLTNNVGSPLIEPEYLVVEAKVSSRLAEQHHFLEIRVALVGGPDAGKSTLLGRLAHGIADNGRGKARLNLLRHRHEISSGRTSSISHEIIGFTNGGEIVNYSTTNISSWQEVCGASAKVVTLLDTCGHPRFLKTTIAGLTGHAPDYACLVVDSRVGGINEMTKEHYGLVMALGLPLFITVTKMDVATKDQLRATVIALMALVRSTAPSCLPNVGSGSWLPPATGSTSPSTFKYVPVIVHNEKDLATVVRRFSDPGLVESTNTMAIPILLLSSVTGENVNLLEKCLSLLPKPEGSNNKDEIDEHRSDIQRIQDPVCYQIEEIYNIPDIGTVVGGFLHSGRIEVHRPMYVFDNKKALGLSRGSGGGGNGSQGSQKMQGSQSRRPTNHTSKGSNGQMGLYLGPVDNDGSFVPVVVKSIHRQRMSMRSTDSGHTATLAIEGPELNRVKVRRGMVVLESDTEPKGKCCQKFEAVIQVLAHDGTFGVGFEGMIHCGSVHRNAIVSRIELLPNPDQQDDQGDIVKDDAKQFDSESATRTASMVTSVEEASPSPHALGYSRNRGVERLSEGESVQERQQSGQSPSSPSSDYESGTSSFLTGSGSTRAGTPVSSEQPQQLQQESDRDPVQESLSQSGSVSCTNIKKLRKLSIQAGDRHDESCLTLHARHDSDDSCNSSINSSSNDGHEGAELSADENKGDRDAELVVGSRARIVFKFCHGVVFMRKGTTVLFRHGRTKCIGKVLRMI